MTRAVDEPKIGLQVDPELAAEQAVRRRRIAFVVRWAERWVIGQHGDIVNPAQLEQDMPDRELYMVLVKRHDLRRQIQGRTSFVENFARDPTARPRAPHHEVQLLQPVAHVGAS